MHDDTEQIARQVSQKLNLSNQEGEIITNIILSFIIAALKEGKQVSLSPLGRFEVYVRPSREATRIGGERYRTREERLLSFSPSKSLKESLSKGKQ